MKSLYVKSSLNGFNDLIGGLPVGSMVGLYGPAQAGKTICTIQMGFDVLRERGGNGIIIDTEGSKPTYAEWFEPLNKRFGTDIEILEVKMIKKELKNSTKIILEPEKQTKKQALFVLDMRDLQDILVALGRGCNFDVSGTGKVSLKIDEPTWIDNINETPIGSFIQKYACTYMAFDSVSYPIVMRFGPNQENFPARSQATGYVMSQLQLLANVFNLVQFGVMHESLNEADPYSRPIPVGGKSINYSYKYIVYMTRDPKGQHLPPSGIEGVKLPKTCRRLFLYRHPSREPWSRVVHMNLGHKGFEEFQRPGESTLTVSTEEEEDN